MCVCYYQYPGLGMYIEYSDSFSTNEAFQWKAIIKNYITGCVTFISNSNWISRQLTSNTISNFGRRCIFLTNLSDEINKLWQEISFHWHPKYFHLRECNCWLQKRLHNHFYVFFTGFIGRQVASRPHKMFIRYRKWFIYLEF